VTVARAAALPQLRLNGSQSHVVQSARPHCAHSLPNGWNGLTRL
jgi:hypothetical protein